MQTKANGPAVSGEQVRRYRLAAHHLDRPLPPGSLTEAAGVCGVQNSPPGAWETALFARVAACTPALLRQALEGNRETAFVEIEPVLAVRESFVPEAPADGSA